MDCSLRSWTSFNGELESHSESQVVYGKIPYDDTRLRLIILLHKYFGARPHQYVEFELTVRGTDSCNIAACAGTPSCRCLHCLQLGGVASKLTAVQFSLAPTGTVVKEN